MKDQIYKKEQAIDAFKSEQKWNPQIINDKEISPFAWYDIIMISREFSELSEDYRARVARIV